MSTIVVMPGGFHPFHAGHKALHESAMQAFPGASVYIAATNDTKTRPFPFSVKEKLAKVAGVPSGQFVQVKSPFQPREITSQFDPKRDVLIYVRSEKDKNESPTPGGTKKDGSPSYLQPYTEGQLHPFGKHAYMAYLPTVEFGPGMTSATEIRDAWTTLDTRRKTALVMSLYPATQKNKRLANVVVRLLDSALGGAEPMNESQSILQVPNNIANTVAELLNHKQQHLFTRYGPEYVMNIIQDVCADAPTKSIHELAVETLQRLKREIKESKEQREFYRIGINELTVNRNIETRDWTVRNDDNFSPIGDVDSVVLKDVRPVIGKEALDSGRNVFAYLRGEKANGIPAGLTPFTIFFKRDLKNPFIDKDTGESIDQVDYVKFDKSGAVIGYKESMAEGMVIGCCPNESLGLPMPGTYEQEYDLYKTHGGPKRITALTTEDSNSSDREVQAILRFAQQHYPEASKQEAFMKFVLHALKHSEQDDARQDAELKNLDHEVDNIEHEVDDIESKVGNVTESADYLEEK